MVSLEILQELALQTPSKIVMLVMDGLGGLPHPETGQTELETARTPHLDDLARRSACGLADPVAPGISPGSGPGHLGLFGYDPLVYQIGRGVLEALGVGFDLDPQDVAARGNYCSVDAEGRVTDRRAGRIATERNASLCPRLRQITLPGVTLFVEPGVEHRFVVVFRGDNLYDALTETDPQRDGLHPLPVKPLVPQATAMAQLVNAFIAQAKAALADAYPANMILLRGFSKYPTIPQMPAIFKLRCAAIATYPMYRGLAKLVGMEVLATGTTIADEIATLRQHYNGYDFFFFHVKKTDTAGEDGDFARKVAALEEVDSFIPQLLELKPEVLIVTGDHSTPASFASHSWHPVPLLLSSKWCRPNNTGGFSEESCRFGTLGRIRSMEIMPLAMAHALKLARYGA